jgi:hypothetical protein
MPLLENDVIRLNNVRLSFPSLKAPKASTSGGALKYRAAFLMAPDSEAAAELQQLIQKVANDEWGTNATVALQIIAADKKLRCYGQGDTKISTKTGKPYEGYAGQFFVEGLSDIPVGMFDENQQPVDNMTMGVKFQGGDYVDGLIRLWAQDNQHGKAIRAELVGVKFNEEGPHFGAERLDPASVFGGPAAAAPAADTAAEAPAAAPNLFG